MGAICWNKQKKCLKPIHFIFFQIGIANKIINVNKKCLNSKNGDLLNIPGFNKICLSNLIKSVDKMMQIINIVIVGSFRFLKEISHELIYNLAIYNPDHQIAKYINSLFTKKG